MATPETRSVEFDPLAPSTDGDLAVMESEPNQIAEAVTRELPAYNFDSNDKTLAGIGSSDSADSNSVRHFDSSDRTLVGIGPKRARRAERAGISELPSHSQQAEPTPQSVPMPHSEPPGPFVASNNDDDTPHSRPKQKGKPWVLALSAMLVAAAAVALLRGVVAHARAHRPRSAATDAPLPTASETRTRDVQFQTAAATSAETSAAETPITQALAAPQAAAPQASAQREKQPELAPRRAATKSTGSEPLGALDVTSNPPSGLVLDGRPLGKAPRVIQLPSGLHTVLFVHPERGRMSITVNVRAGRTTSASADF